MTDLAPDPAFPPTRLAGLPPVLDARTRVVVLGSFPGAASLAAGQYYAHPRNRFWPLLSTLWGIDLVAMDAQARHAALRARGLGLWDVYASCTRTGSLDADIRDARLNDLGELARRAPGLRAVLHNGRASARERRASEALGVEVHALPSTSPANAAWTLSRLAAVWGEPLGRLL